MYQKIYDASLNQPMECPKNSIKREKLFILGLSQRLESDSQHLRYKIGDIHINPQDLPIWDTSVIELTSPQDNPVRLRTYNPNPAQKSPVILYIPGFDDGVPYGGDPFVENGVNSVFPLYSGEWEMSEADEDTPLQMQLITQNIPNPIDEFRILKGPYERHNITLAWLNALQQWLIS